MVSREGEDEVVARVPALPAGEQYGFAEFEIPEAGCWTITGCLNSPEDDGRNGPCVEEAVRLLSANGNPEVFRDGKAAFGLGWGPF